MQLQCNDYVLFDTIIFTWTLFKATDYYPRPHSHLSPGILSPIAVCMFPPHFYPQLRIVKCWLNNTPRSLCLCEKWELWNITWITPMVHRRTMLYLCTWKSESPVFKQGLHPIAHPISECVSCLNSVLFFDPKTQLSSFTTRLIHQLCLHSYNIVIRPTHAVVGHNSE
jgi:hypothetical protein